jgi:hypothetical protein
MDDGRSPESRDLIEQLDGQLEHLVTREASTCHSLVECLTFDEGGADEPPVGVLLDDIDDDPQRLGS